MRTVAGKVVVITLVAVMVLGGRVETIVVVDTEVTKIVDTMGVGLAGRVEVTVAVAAKVVSDVSVTVVVPISTPV